MGKTVIVIDDDQDDLDMMKFVLKKIDPNIRYISFNHPAVAIEQLSVDEFPLPDYIFIDLNMPTMLGSECLKELRKVNKLEDVQIIMFSTYISNKDSDILKKSGATSTFQKPCDVNGYVEILRELTLM